ncbi:hypothetical protein KA478_01325 [Patescibacteria group bacterium]|nr:hypothetical protein [Patescibacteria group bacterium]
MIVEKALSFFTSVDALSDARPEMTGFTSFNEEEHSPSDINRKKTAQLGKKMTTIFEKDTITSGKIVYVTSDNRDTGYSTT